MCEVLPHNIPAVNEEIDIKSIWTRTLVPFHGIQNIKYLAISNRNNEGIRLRRTDVLEGEKIEILLI